MLIDNFGIILQVEWRKQDSQFKIKIKIFLKPKCENGKEYSRIRDPRPNDARSQVRCGHDVNNRCKLIVDWLKLSWMAQLYKLVAEWLCVNTRYGTFAIAYISAFADTTMDLFPNEQNFDLDKSRQKFHHSLKEHHKISNIPKFCCEIL
jgi:hypothetical protein